MANRPVHGASGYLQQREGDKLSEAVERLEADLARIISQPSTSHAETILALVRAHQEAGMDHETAIREVHAVVTDNWCGYAAPLVGRCQCGDQANHERGGIYYHPRRVPSSAVTEAAKTMGLL